MSQNWTEEQSLTLIELVRACPNIWNPENETYKNKNRRTDAFNNIAEALGISREECERKWKVLQNQFRRECIKSVTKSGQGTSELYVSHWFGYKHLMFLRDKNKPRHTRDTQMEVSKRDFFIAYIYSIIIIILTLAHTILFFIPFCLATVLSHWLKNSLQVVPEPLVLLWLLFDQFFLHSKMFLRVLVRFARFQDSKFGRKYLPYRSIQADSTNLRLL